MVEKNRKLLALGAIAVAGALVAGTASAQNWPNRAVRIINPFPAGGGTDAFARPLAAVMPKDLGQQILIENLGGAGGTLGAGVASRANPDGYTWFMGAVHHTIAETLYRKLNYSLTKDFVPVTLAASVPSAVVVHPSVPAKTIKELIALDKRSPGAINYGSAGYGTTHHMNGELFNLITGTKLTHVPYKGAGPLTPALLSGEVAMAFDGMGTAGPNVKSGRLRGLRSPPRRAPRCCRRCRRCRSPASTSTSPPGTCCGASAARRNRSSIACTSCGWPESSCDCLEIRKVWDSLGATAGGQPPANSASSCNRRSTPGARS